MRRWRHASCAIWALGGAHYGATKRVRGVTTWVVGAMLMMPMMIRIMWVTMMLQVMMLMDDGRS
eukprot:9486334-Pyramimonas_sp.AAC.2